MKVLLLSCNRLTLLHLLLLKHYCKIYVYRMFFENFSEIGFSKILKNDEILKTF